MKQGLRTQRFVFRCILAMMCCLPVRGVSQIDSILLLEPVHQALAVKQLYAGLLTEDTTTVFSRIAQFESKSRRQGASLLAQQFHSLQHRYRIDMLPAQDPLRIQIALTALEEASRKGWEAMEAEWMIRSGLQFFEMRHYGPAFEYLLRGHQRSMELGFDRYPHLREFLLVTGLVHYEFGDYATALKFFKSILEVRDQWPDPWSLTNAINTAALCFQQIEQYDSALHYFTLARDHTLEVLQDTAYAIMIDGNRATALRRLGRIDEALDLLEQDYQLSQKNDMTGSAVNAALEMASIHLDHGDALAASTYIEFARQHIERDQARPLRVFYENSYRYHRATGAWAQAFTYLDSAQVLQDSLRKAHDNRLLLHARQQVEVEKYRHDLRMLEALRERQVLLRNAALMIILLAGLAAILWYHRRYVQRKKDLEIAELSKQLTEEELSTAHLELQAFTRVLREKNAMIESIHDQLSTLQQEAKPGVIAEYMSALTNHTILTEDDWQQFRILFEKVYPGYFFRMKDQFPDITPADMRLLALTKLRLSPKEMAALLGITYDAIKKSRRRLRQRINLPGEGSLDEVAESI